MFFDDFQNNTRISTSVDLAFLVVPKLPLMKSFDFGHGISTLKKVVAKSAVAKNAMVRTMPCSTPLIRSSTMLLCGVDCHPVRNGVLQTCETTRVAIGVADSQHRLATVQHIRVAGPL